MPDKYDNAVEYLTKNPSEIERAWYDPFSHVSSGCLFKFVTPNGCCYFNRIAHGCLTSVRDGSIAYTPELTEAIRADERIPMRGDNIEVKHLPVFAEWQRRLDKEFNRK